MPPLTSRILHPPASKDNPYEELDIFSSSLATLFPDDVQNFHGVPGSHVIYRSPCFGDITLHIPAHPDVEEGRNLFAHYLWNAGVTMAEGIEWASARARRDRDDGGEEDSDQLRRQPSSPWKQTYWDVKEKSVLELGAGTGLPSIISALCGAHSVTVTDHLSSPSLTTHAVRRNVEENLQHVGDHVPAVQVRGYSWGDGVMYSSQKYGQTIPESRGEKYDRILLADCLWMPSQHQNLVGTAERYLRDDDDGSACALVVAGFHTGRQIVASFFAQADLGRASGASPRKATRLKVADIFEIDVDGNTRRWNEEREGETKEALKRWCVCAVLVK